MDRPIQNLRISFYGVQGSGSVFPSRADRDALRQLVDLRLLEQVFLDIQKHADSAGTLNCTLKDILGGDIDEKTMREYRQRFHIEDARVYGGWTTCIRVETADGNDIIFDLGSGFRNCAIDLQEKWGDKEQRELFIFGSHSHYDHTEGFDQAAVCFDPRNKIHIYGNRQFLRALDQNLGIFTHEVASDLLGTITPLHYGLMPAKFDSCEIRDEKIQSHSEDMSDKLAHSYQHWEEPIQIGGTTVSAFEVYHPAPCLGFKIEHRGKTFVYCTDHELRHGDDPSDPRQAASLAAERRLKKLAQGADVMYRDGQFLRAEYDGHQPLGAQVGVPRIDWGHSCVEDIIEMAEACDIKATYIGHHDPNRDWSARNWMHETLVRRGKQMGRRFELARAETVIDI